MSEVAEFIKQVKEVGFAKLTGRFYSLYRGRVVANNDPEGLYRLRLEVPGVWGATKSQEWAWPMLNFSGTGFGFWGLPEPGELVWVAFEEGNPDLPLWGYGHWNKKHIPPKVKAGAITLTTAKGQFMELDQQSNSAKLQNTKVAVAVVETKVHLGNPDGSGHESGVLGETLVQLIAELMDVLTVEVAGPWPLMSKPKYQEIKAKAQKILSKTVTLKK